MSFAHRSSKLSFEPLSPSDSVPAARGRVGGNKIKNKCKAFMRFMRQHKATF